MPKIIFKKVSGETEEVKIRVGDSIMQAAVDNGIDEIVAECGGNCVCATCHCYIEESFVSKLSEMDDFENASLELDKSSSVDSESESLEIVLYDEEENHDEQDKEEISECL